MMNTYILLPHIKIHNANAMSSPWIVGFPAMTAWLGAVHALERKLHAAGVDETVHFPATGIVCHHADLQVYHGQGFRDLISITANPLRKKGKDFERPPFIAEVRIDLDVSLLIKVEGLDPDDADSLKESIMEQLPGMKMAAGDIVKSGTVSLHYPSTESEERKLLCRMMPGYACIERKDLLTAYEEKGMDSLDAMLTLLGVHQHAELDEEGDVRKWHFSRVEPGWLVPLAVGFKGISPLGNVKNQRDAAYPHQFAESIATLGEFKMVHRFHSIQDILWHYEYHSDSDLYVCKNQ